MCSALDLRARTPAAPVKKRGITNFFGLQLPLFRFFLAGNAVACPRHSFEALLLQFLVTGIALAVAAVFNAVQRLIDQVKQGAVVVRLAKEELFGVGVGGLIRHIHGGIFVSLAAFLFGAGDRAHQFFAAYRQFLFVIIQSLLIHG